MALSIAIAGTPVSWKVPPSGLSLTTRADRGDVGFGGMPADDATGTIAVTGHATVTVTESACTAQPRLFSGYLTDRDMGRSLERGMFLGEDARLVDASIVDLNACLNFRLFHTAAANRPEETIEDRLAWLVATAEVTDYIENVTDFVAADLSAPHQALTMDAADYRGQTPSAVLADIAARPWVGYTGDELIYFVFWDATSSKVALFIDPFNSATYDSSVSISNDPTDVDSDYTFAPTYEARLKRSPEQTYSGVIVEYANGRVYRHRPTTASAYVARDSSITMSRTGRQETAIRQAEAWLTAHAAERDVVTCEIRVPRTRAGLVTAGMRVDCRFTHLPGYEDWVSLRVVTCSPKPTDDLALYYDLELELAAPLPSADPPSPTCTYVAPVLTGYSSEDAWGARYGSSASPPFLPADPVPAVTASVSGYYYNSAPITEYGTANDGSEFGVAAGVTGWAQTVVATWTWDLGTPRAVCTVLYDETQDYGNPSFRMSADGVAWTEIIDTATIRSNTPNGTLVTLTAPYPEYRYVQLYWSYTTQSGLKYFPGQVFDKIMVWTGDNDDPPDETTVLPPPPGTTVPVETPTPAADGTTTTFSTAGPYRPGSLLVYVDGIPIPTSEVTETDPGAGTFTLSWAPDADERLTVMYVAG